jgi:hypothetical protein
MGTIGSGFYSKCGGRSKSKELRLTRGESWELLHDDGPAPIAYLVETLETWPTTNGRRLT